MIKIKTGNKVPISGQYSNSKTSTEVTLIKGKTVPPTNKGAAIFTLVDKTKNKGAR